MRSDLKKLRHRHGSDYVISKENWILQTLKSMNDVEDTNLGTKQLAILEKSLVVNPNSASTPFSKMW